MSNNIPKDRTPSPYDEAGRSFKNLSAGDQIAAGGTLFILGILGGISAIAALFSMF